MADNVCTVTGTIVNSDNTDLTSGFVSFLLSEPDVDIATNQTIVPQLKTAVIQPDGTISIPLWPNERGLKGTFYNVWVVQKTVEGETETRVGRIQPPDQAAAVLEDLLEVTVLAGAGMIAQAALYSVLTQTQYDAVIAAQTATETARDEAVGAAEAFTDQYLGAFASDPTVDNDGDPLTEGDLYVNTTDDTLRFYTGSGWVSAGSGATLPSRLGETAAVAADWNDAIQFGAYKGNNLPNGPDGNFHFGIVIPHNANYLVQMVWSIDLSTSTIVGSFQRYKQNGVWDASWEETHSTTAEIEAVITDFLNGQRAYELGSTGGVGLFVFDIHTENGANGYDGRFILQPASAGSHFQMVNRRTDGTTLDTLWLEGTAGQLRWDGRDFFTNNIVSSEGGLYTASGGYLSHSASHLASAMSAIKGSSTTPATESPYAQPALFVELHTAEDRTTAHSIWGNAYKMAAITAEARAYSGFFGELNGGAFRASSNVAPVTSDVFGKIMVGVSGLGQTNTGAGNDSYDVWGGNFVAAQTTGNAPVNVVGIEVDVLNGSNSAGLAPGTVGATNFTGVWSQADPQSGAGSDAAFYASHTATGLGWGEILLFNGLATRHLINVENTLNAATAKGMRLEIAWGADTGRAMEIFASGNELFRITGDATNPIHGRFAGVLKQVTQGAANSGDPGHRVLQVPN